MSQLFTDDELFGKPSSAGNLLTDEDLFGSGSASAKREAVPNATPLSFGQDVLSGALQIGPTFVKGVADIGRLATGDRIGKDTSEAMETGIKSIQDVVGSERGAAQRKNFQADMADENVNFVDAIRNNKGALADQVLPTLGSMILPVGVAGAAGKFATLGKAVQNMDKATIAARVLSAQKAAGIGTVAAQNASDTFAELIDRGVPMEDAYLGAGITVPFSVVAGKLTGGGAEQAITSALTRSAATKLGVKSLAKAAGQEGAQEMGEEIGQITGEAVAADEIPTANTVSKRLAVAGTLGAVMGGGANVATQTRDVFGKQQEVPAVAQPETPEVTAPTAPEQPAPAVTANDPTRDPFERLAEISLISEQRELTPAESGEYTQLVTQIESGEAYSENEAPAPADPAAIPGNEVTQHTITAPDIKTAVQTAAQQYGPDAIITNHENTPDGVALTVAVPDQAGAVPASSSAIGELQNRDRSRAASVNQMQSIARNPDYMRLGPSRTPDSGAPMVFATGNDLSAIQPTHFGRDDIAVMADGQRVPFRYAVVDANTVNPSNFADGTANPAFESGEPGVLKALNNGRTAGMRAAHGAGNGQAYTAELIADAQSHGVPVDAIRSTPNPMLVRVYSEGSNTNDMAAKSQGQGLGMSPAELAQQDAPLIDLSALAVYEPGDIASAGNRDFVRSFVGGLQASGQDIAPLITADGQLSQMGRQRIQAALMQSAYGDVDLVQEMFDSVDTDIKAIGEALKSVAGAWAGMRQAAKIGAINPETDITGNLVQVVRMIQQARRNKTSIYDMINQRDLMTGETPDALTVSILRLFYTGNYLTRAVGKERLIDSLSRYLTGAMQTQEGGGLFGDTVTAQDILNAITQDGKNDGGNQAENGSSEPGSSGIARGGADRPGAQASRPGTDEAGRGIDEAGREAPAKDQPEASAQEGGEGVGAEGLTLTGETNTEAAANAARTESDEVSKAQADRERDAVPFSLATESQPKPVGVQGGLKFSKSPGAPSRQFVTAPDGSIDFGEITENQSSVMRRQPGKIRLTIGIQNADGTGHGLVHIEANHGKQIRNAGFGSVEEFVSHVASSFGQVWGAPGVQLLATVRDGKQHMMYVELEQTVDKDGEYYRVNSAFPVRQEDYPERHGFKKLWDGSEPASAVTGEQPAFAGQSESSSGQTTPNARSQSDSNIQPTLEDIKSGWKDRGITANLFENKGVITLSRIVVPEGQRDQGIGTQAMQELVDYSDANGKHIALSPSADFGGNKKRLIGFYKRFGFVENKGRNRAFSVSESMVRENQNATAPLYSFAGQSAATADTHALSTAQQRLNAGEDAETVRKETGWFIGADGKPRFEIDDSGASLKADGRTFGDVFNAIKSNGPVVLSDVIDHPALFAAYPDLASLRVRLIPFSEQGLAIARYVSNGNPMFGGTRIEVEKTEDSATALSALLHEIQHGIQTIEGFASGGSAKGVSDQYRENKINLDVIDDKIDRNFRQAESYGELVIKYLTDAEKKLILDRTEEFAELYESNQDRLNAAAGNISDYISEDEISDERGKSHLRDQSAAQNAIAAYSKQRDKLLKQTNSVEFNGVTGTYERLAGEVEARNVQSRQNLTNEQRRNQSPESTQDVANSDVIIVFNGKEMASAPAPANAVGYVAPITEQQATAAITNILGKAGKLLIDAGQIVLVRTEEGLKNLPGAKFMTAWHGSPHDHNKFDSSKIGTGEGAQAYGFGLYFSGARSVAEYYRDALRGKSGYDLSAKAQEFGFEINAGQRGEVVRQVQAGKDDGSSAKRIAKRIQNAKSSMRDIDSAALERLVSDFMDNGYGKLYQVELAPSEDEYLDWDKPLSEQSEFVREAIASIEQKQITELPSGFVVGETETNGKMYPAVFKPDGYVIASSIAKTREDAIRRAISAMNSEIEVIEDASYGKSIYHQLERIKGSDKEASNFLYDAAGIRGIRYIDGSSRKEGEGNHNFVIFNDADVSITAKHSRQNALQSNDGLPNESPVDRTIDAAELAALRGAASRLERPQDGVFLRVTEYGRAIATGPKGIRIPDTFVRFAKDHDLAFEARRNGEGRKSNDVTVGKHITSKTEPMPPAYREAGALYFGEGNVYFDRTGKTRFAKDDGAIQGATLPDGRIVLVLENLTQDNIAGVLKHEGFHATIRALVGEETYQQIMGKLGAMRKAGNGAAWFKQALAAVPEGTAESDVNEEIGAYAVEGYENGEPQPLVIRNWVKSLLSALRTAIIRRMPAGKLKNWAIANITGQDMARLAVAGLRAKASRIEQAQGREAVAYSKGENPTDREFADTERAYGGREAYDKAKADGKTKLNYRQWVQVRTNSFKNWFGDWESFAILNAKPLASLSVSDAPNGGFKDVEKWAADLFAKQGGKAVRRGFGEVLLDHRATQTSMAHGGANKYKKIAFAAVKDVIERGALVVSKSGQQEDSFYFSAPIDIDGVVNIETVLVHRDPNTQRMYLHSVTTKENLLNQRVSSADTEVSGRSGSTSAGGISIVVQDLLKGNGVSKVIDPQTGEPMVVYHGTKNDFTSFNPDSHFGTKDQADTILAERRGKVGKRVMPVYLSVQKMKRVKDQEIAQRWADVVATAKRQGYDGLIYKNEFEGDGTQDSYVVFNPEQIKSAIGNNGDFDGQNPDIRYSRASVKAKVDELTSPDAINTLIYNFQNKYIDLKNIKDRIIKMGGQITDLNDAYLGEETYHSKVMKRGKDFLANELKQLLQQLHNNTIKKEDFEQFLHARHAPERNAEMAKRNPNQAMIDAGRTQADADVMALEVQLQSAMAKNLATKAIESALTKARSEKTKWHGAQAFQGTEDERNSLSGMSDAEAAQIMAAIPAGRRSTMNSAAAKVDAINAKTLDIQLAAGLIDKASFDAIKKAYQFYVPLHRDEAHPDQSAHSIGQGFSVKGAGIQRATGSNAKVTNILGHIAMQREAQNTRAEKNSVVKRLYLMAAQNPLKDFWSIDKPPMIKTIDERTGFVRSGVDPMYKNKPNVVMVRIAGKDVAIVFNEQNPEAVRLAEALKNLDGQDLDVVERTLGRVTRWIASVNTQYNPIFGLINFARDVQGAMFNLTTTELKDHKAATWKETFRLFKEITKSGFQLDKMNAADQALWNDFQNNGGATGYRDMFANPEERTKALEKELKALDGGPVAKKFAATAQWLSDYNESMENVVRLAAYKISLQNGMSKERAASLAKNLTVNFNRKGAKAQKLGAFYAFFNASIQGSTRLAQTLKGPAGRRIIAGGIALGVMQQMLGMMMMGGGDDDEWEKIPDFIKERSIVIPTSKDTFISIPMPLGFNVIPNIGRLFAEWATGGSDKPTGAQLAKLAGVIVGGFNPVGGTDMVDAVTPTAADPMIALLRNKDWTGKPIYREDMAGNDPSPGFSRTKDSATPWAKGLAYAVNWATKGTDHQAGAISWTPDQIDYVIGTVTGGAGRELGKLAQTLAAPFSADELPMHKVPLFGRVIGSTAGVSGQSGKFYENIRTLNGFEREIKGRNEAGEDVDEFLDSEPRAGLVGLANASEKQVKQLRKAQKLLKAEGDNAGAKEIDLTIAEVMKGLNMEMRQAAR